MATKRILVPFDISEYSLDASNEAIELARLFGVSITFIHIVQPEPQYDISTICHRQNEKSKMKLLQK
jgi:nucleotide-binding universal stress UspA family protein